MFFQTGNTNEDEMEAWISSNQVSCFNGLINKRFVHVMFVILFYNLKRRFSYYSRQLCKQFINLLVSGHPDYIIQILFKVFDRKIEAFKQAF